MFLCETCHEQSPDIKDEYSFMLWLTERKSSTIFGFDYKFFFNTLEDLFKNHNKNTEYDFLKLDMDKFLLILNEIGGMEEFKEYASKTLTSHGGRISKTSYPTLLFSFINKYQNEKFQSFLKSIHN